MKNLPTLMLNKTGSPVSIRRFYPRMKRYGETVGKLDPDGYMFIDPSKLEQLSRDNFTPIEIHACSEEEVIQISILKIEGCDGIVLYMDGKNKFSAKFVKRGKTYDREWLMRISPDVGVQQRIDYILSFMNTGAGAQPSTSKHSEAAAQP